MKKFISLLLALAVIAISASSVFATVSIVPDGSDKLIDATTIPAKSYYQAVIPSTSIVATQLLTAEEVAAATTSKFSKQASVATYDVYKLDITVSDMGELVNGNDTDWDSAYAGVFAITAAFPTTAFAKFYIDDAQLAGGTASCGQDGDIFNVIWAAAKGSNPYPIFDDKADPTDAQYVANGSMSVTVFVAITKDSELNLTNVATSVNYVGSAFTGGSVMNENAANATLKLPPASDVTKIETAETKSNIANGATGLLDRDGNEATIAKNYGITKFSPTLNTATKNYFINAKDSDGKEMGKRALNFNAQSIEGKATFYVIIKSADHVISDIWIEEENAE